jgi:hypothetical protein
MIYNHWVWLHLAVCLFGAFAMFCRLRLTNQSTHIYVRWAIAGVLTASIAGGIAAFFWAAYWGKIQTVVLASWVVLQWAMSRQWGNNQAPNGLK